MNSTHQANAQKILQPLTIPLQALVQQLVRTNSVATLSGGDETPAQLVLQEFFRQQGLLSELYDTGFIANSDLRAVKRSKSYAGRKNLSVRLQGSGRGKSLLLNGHIDTVPPGNKPWLYSPWSGHYEQGRIHGLGSFDMKAGVAANAAVICALHRAGIRTGGDILFESVVDEEWGGGGGTIAARLRGDSADACVIPEGTQLEIYRATRGGFIVDLAVDAGDPAAYFSSAEVVSPAMHLGRLLEWVSASAGKRKNLKPRGVHACFPDPAPVQILAVESNRIDPEVPLSVPSCATVRVYWQFLPEEDLDAVIEEIRSEFDHFCAGDAFFRTHPVQWLPVIEPIYGHELASDHPWLDCEQTSATKVLGREVITAAAPYPCDAGLIHREFEIPTLLFGPCGAGAHNPNEYVDFESVLRTAEVLCAAALQWTGA